MDVVISSVLCLASIALWAGVYIVGSCSSVPRPPGAGRRLLMASAASASAAGPQQARMHGYDHELLLNPVSPRGGWRARRGSGSSSSRDSESRRSMTRVIYDSALGSWRARLHAQGRHQHRLLATKVALAKTSGLCSSWNAIIAVGILCCLLFGGSAVLAVLELKAGKGVRPWAAAADKAPSSSRASLLTGERTAHVL